MAYQAVETALLTEANLPWYTAILAEYFSDRSSPLGEFVRTWTSEEDQHGMLLESYLLITANGDHRARARIRRQVVGQGWRYALFSPLEVMTYTAVQEAQTRAFYIHSARFCGAEDEQLGRALRRISRDETLHFTFYRDAVRAWLQLDPECLPQVARVVTGFKMPSWAIPDYAEREAALSEDIFGPPEFLIDVLDEVYTAWDIDSLPVVTREAHRARVALQAYRRAVTRLAAKQPRPRNAEAVR
jgi:acyl-[acyl-carrier-protein] desaturase